MRPILLWALLCAVCLPAIAAKPQARAPTDPHEIIERLPRGYAELMPGAANNGSVTEHAARLLEIASRTGENRLVARADALLSRFPPDSTDPQLLRLRAYSAQHRHDFANALRSLDRLIVVAPRDADARLSRAQINLVQGRLNLARRDCVTLSLEMDAGHGLLCTAALSKRRGDYAAAATLLDRWFQQDRDQQDRDQQDRDEQGLRVYVSRMRAEVAVDAGAADARARFEQTLALAPEDVRTRIAYARYLRASGRPSDALALLAGEISSETALLQRALAAKEAGSAEAESLAAILERRFRAAHALGAPTEYRDEAEFLLGLRGDAAGALSMALRQVETQRDEEDLRLLQRAAMAAGRPEALRPMRAWAREQGLSEDFAEKRR